MDTGNKRCLSVSRPASAHEDLTNESRLFFGRALETIADSILYQLRYSPIVLKTADAVVRATNQSLIDETLSRRSNSLDTTFWSQDINIKSVGDYVTKMDLILDGNLKTALKKIANIPIVSEEDKLQHDYLKHKKCWMLDPLDATTAYICKELDLCGPMVVMLHNGKPQFSIMLNLSSTRLAIAELGNGASLIEYSYSMTSCSHTKLKQKPLEMLSQGRVLLNVQADKSNSHPQFLKIVDKLSTGTHALTVETKLPHSMAALSLNQNNNIVVVHDNSAEHPKQMPWDILPVKLWVEESGGVFCNLDGTSYDLSRPQPILIAVSQNIAEQVIELVS